MQLQQHGICAPAEWYWRPTRKQRQALHVQVQVKKRCYKVFLPFWLKEKTWGKKNQLDCSLSALGCLSTRAVKQMCFFTQVSQDGKALLDVLQRPLSPGNSESLTATANYSKAVHQVLDVVHEVLHHQRRLESIWQHRKVRLHQRLQLCVFQQDVQQVIPLLKEVKNGLLFADIKICLVPYLENIATTKILCTALPVLEPCWNTNAPFSISQFHIEVISQSTDYWSIHSLRECDTLFSG